MMPPLQGSRGRDEGAQGTGADGTGTRLREIAERERIVRELHDVVAHSVSEIVVQAAAHRHAHGDGDPATDGVLASIERRGRELLGDIRRLTAGARAAGQPMELAPTPRLRDLERLASRMRKAGLDVELAVIGESLALAPGIEVSAYRIVEDALSAAGVVDGLGSARVSVRYGRAELELEVLVRDGETIEADEGGLVGMRKRAELLGGSIDSGRRNGRYAIRARFPIERS